MHTITILTMTIHTEMGKKIVPYDGFYSFFMRKPTTFIPSIPLYPSFTNVHRFTSNRSSSSSSFFLVVYLSRVGLPCSPSIYRIYSETHTHTYSMDNRRTRKQQSAHKLKVIVIHRQSDNNKYASGHRPWNEFFSKRSRVGFSRITSRAHKHTLCCYCCCSSFSTLCVSNLGDDFEAWARWLCVCATCHMPLRIHDKMTDYNL